MNVVVLLPLSAAQRSRLERLAPGAAYTYLVDTDTDYMVSQQPQAGEPSLAQADVIVGNLAPKRLGEAPNLRLLQLNSAGYEQYVASDALCPEVLLCNASGAYGPAVSEHLFAMVLSQMKKLPLYAKDQQQKIWSDHGRVTSFKGSRVLVLGAGDIGSHFASLARAMGATVDGVRRHVVPTPGFDQIFAQDDILSVLPNYDVVVSFMPSTPETRGLANEQFFAAMRPGAFFANGGRGDLVDQDALVGALESGHIAGASLDVVTPEPLGADSPLWDAPNLLLTPHVSGGFHLEATLDAICDIAAQNIASLMAGEPLRNVIEH